MTLRAVVIGLLATIVLSSVTFFNDMVIRGTYLIGNFLPVSVFGVLILFLLLVNPLLAKVKRSAALTGRELGVIVALVLFACYVPGRGLMHAFTPFLMMPHHFARTIPGWQGEPARLAPDAVKDWQLLAAGLAGAQDGDGVRVRSAVRERLPKSLRERLDSDAVVLADDPNFQGEVIKDLNTVLEDRALARTEGVGDLALPTYVRNLLRRDPESLDSVTLRSLNRGILDVAFDGALKRRRAAALEYANPRMLADIDRETTTVLDGFINGIAVGDKAISFKDVPWFAWRRTMLFWIPLMLTLCFGVTGLSLVLHRQWAKHENLPYPTVEFARSLLPEEGELQNSIFRNRLFWTALLAVFLLHMNNYAHTWWPNYLVPVNRRFNFWALQEIVPIFRKAQVGTWGIFAPTLYLMVVGFAYFLPADVSLSLGVAPYVMALGTAIAATYGVSTGGRFLQPCINTFLYAGGFSSMFLVLLYTGRQYYTSVVRRGIGLPARDTVETNAVWGIRVFAVAMALFVVQLMCVGLDVHVAMLYTLGTLITVVVCSRLLCEAGVFYVHTYFFPCVIVWGFLGARAIGPNQLLTMGILSSVLLIEPRETFMPFAASGLQLVDRTRGRIGKTALWGGVSLIIAFAVAVPITLYLQYQYGAIRVGDSWTCNGIPKLAFDANNLVRNTLAAQGELHAAETMSGWARLGQIAPITPCMVAFAITFGGVLLFTYLRHRLPWWPLHPLLFLVLATWQGLTMSFSFLVGWLVKGVITKYGGATAYQRCKPMMIGLIAGEMLAGIIPLIIGIIYYQVTGEIPKPFAVLR